MNCGFFLTTLANVVFGLILNETAMIPPESETYKHMTAEFGLQSDDPRYERSAPIVALEPATACTIENGYELEGAIVLAMIGECDYPKLVATVQDWKGLGLIVGNIHDTLIWMKSSVPIYVSIPCVFVTKSTYDAALSDINHQPAETVIATISKAGEVAPPKLWSFPKLMQIVTYMLIIFPVVWAILGLKHFWWRYRGSRREERRMRIRSQNLPDVLFTKDLLDPESESEVSTIRRRQTRLTNNSCPICLENFEEQTKIKLLSCEHGFHLECIGPWLEELNDSCPICRQTITVKEEDSELRPRCRFCCHCLLCWNRNEQELNQPLLILGAEDGEQDVENVVEENHGSDLR